MTAKKFRTLALRFPEAVEQSHMGHPDFRVGGKVFATLCPDEGWGMCKVTPDVQATLVRLQPGVFEPASGAWGRSGCTIVHLAKADTEAVAEALTTAWRNTAPQRLVREFDET